MFLKTGITFDTLRLLGKMPISNDLLIKRDSGFEMLCFKSLRIQIGMQSGPVDLVFDRKLTTLATSSGVVGVIKIELGLGFCKKVSNLVFEGGMV